MRRLFDRLAKAIAHIVLRVFFRDIAVVDVAGVPATGPVLFVANHDNGLVDPLLLFASVPRVPRFLGKSTLWNMVVLRPFLALGGVIPVYRRQDEGADVSKNVETFARCREVLQAGGAVALFPEGTTHSEPFLQPLRTGAARITLETLEASPELPLRIVPVGLVFESKEEFRSRALVQIGAPVDPLQVVPRTAQNEEERRSTVRALTEHLDERLRAVTLNYSSWDEARLFDQAADLYLDTVQIVDRSDLSARVATRHAFVAAYPEMRNLYPEAVERVRKSVSRYVELLALFALEDRHVASEPPPRTVVRFVLRTLVGLFLFLPLAAVGIPLNWLPYRIPGWVAALAADGSEVRATYKVFTGIVLFPLVWSLEIAGAAWLWGPWGGSLVAVLAPLTGWFALRFNEEREGFVESARAYLYLRARTPVAEILRTSRADAIRSLTELVERYEERPGRRGEQFSD